MAMLFGFYADIKFKSGSPNAEFCKYFETDLMEKLADISEEIEFNGDDTYLGLLPYMLMDIDNEHIASKAYEIQESCWRAFIRGITNIENGIRIYYDAAQGGEKDFFKKLFDAETNIKDVLIRVDRDDESAVEEMGKNFKVKFKR